MLEVIHQVVMIDVVYDYMQRQRSLLVPSKLGQATDETNKSHQQRGYKSFLKVISDTNVISKWESITYATSWHMDCGFPPTPKKVVVSMIIFLSSSLLELIDNLAIKVQEVEDVASSLAEVVGSEQMLLEECADLLHQAHNMQVRFHLKQNEYLNWHKHSSIQSFIMWRYA